MLAALLSMMAADLQLDEYVTHYWQDFPLQVSIYAAASDSDICRGESTSECLSQCPKTAAESKSGQLKPEDLNRVLFPICCYRTSLPIPTTIVHFG